MGLESCKEDEESARFSFLERLRDRPNPTRPKLTSLRLLALPHWRQRPCGFHGLIHAVRHQYQLLFFVGVTLTPGL